MSPAPIDPAIAITLRLALAGVLVHAAVHKLRDASGFRAVLADYQLLPSSLTPLVAATLPGAEVAAAVSLLVLPGAASALAVAGLLGVYAAAIGINLVRDRRSIDCGCSGPLARMPITASLVWRNAILGALALVCALPVGTRELVGFEIVSIAAGAASLLCIHLASEVAIANHLRGLRPGLGPW